MNTEATTLKTLATELGMQHHELIAFALPVFEEYGNPNELAEDTPITSTDAAFIREAAAQ